MSSDKKKYISYCILYSAVEGKHRINLRIVNQPYEFELPAIPFHGFSSMVGTSSIDNEDFDVFLGVILL